MRVVAAGAVLAVHGGVIAALFLASPEPSPIEEPQVVQIRLVELAPEVQQIQAPEAPTPPAPPTPPEPEQPTPPEPPPPEPPPPEPEPPPPEPEPEPEPPPPPPPPEPPPKPKPEPPPKPKPQPPKPQPPKPVPPKPTPPVPTPQIPPPQQPALPPSGTPGATETKATAPVPALDPDRPRVIGTANYDGAGPSPNYPRASQRMREEGTTVVRVTIGVRGNAENVVVQVSSGFPRLDEEAVRAARRVKYKPYTENGVPFPSMVDIPINFQLR